jgi:hypothetical protein
MKLVEVYSARNLAQAELLVRVLRSHGIHAEITDVAAGAMWNLPTKVRVSEDELADARELVEEFLRKGEEAAGMPWVCPTCGEKLDPQFSECWNCETPRPDQSPPATPADDPTLPADVAPDPEIVAELPCTRCQYNLRGLSIGGFCPECGSPILRSVLTMLGFVSSHEGGITSAKKRMRAALAWLEQHTGVPIEGIEFVHHVWDRAWDGKPEPDPARMAQAVREQAAEYSGSPISAERDLAAWNLDTPDKLARLIAWLIEQRVVDVQ